jgi:O-antigen/teichoic acid export membrane protein
MFGKRILKNTVVLAVGKVIVIGLSFFTLTLTTRYLGPEQYGILGTVTVFLTFFAISTDLGLSLFGLRELAQSQKDEGYILSSLFSLRIVMSLFSMVLAVLIGLLLGYSGQVVTGIAIMAPTLMFNTATSAISIYFQHHLHMRYVAVGEIISKVASLGALLYVIHSKLSLNAFFWINVFGTVVFCAAVFWFARRKVKLRFSFNFPYWRQALWLSIPLGLATVLNTIYYRLDTVLLSLLNVAHSVVPHISNYQAVGLYSVPYRLIEVIMVFPGLFIVSVFPIMAKHTELSDLWARRTQRAYDFLIIFAVPLVFFVWLFATQIIRVVAGPGFELSVDLLKILVFGVSISFLNAFLGFLLVSRHHETDILKLSVVTIISNFILNIILIPYYSFYAAAWTSVFSEALCFIVSIYFIWRRFKLIPSHLTALKSLLAAVVACLPILWIAHLPMTGPAHQVFLIVMGAAAIFALVYFPLLIPLRAVKIQDIRETLQLSGKAEEEAS